MPDDRRLKYAGFWDSATQAEQAKPAPRLPRPAGDPMLERSIKLLGTYFPAAAARTIEPADWESSIRSPDILGETDASKNVLINRLLLALSPELDVHRVLGHELIHTTQPPQPLREALMPYEEQPQELEASKGSWDLWRAIRRNLPDEQEQYYKSLGFPYKFSPSAGIPFDPLERQDRIRAGVLRSELKNKIDSRK